MAVLKWILIALLSFVFFTAAAMSVMIYLSPEKTAEANGKQGINSIKNTKSKNGKSSGGSPLADELKEYKTKYQQLESKYDSLDAEAANHLAAIKLKDLEIEKLTSSLAGKTDRNARAKDIAKTLSSMKVTKIAPILGKLDDQTVIAIYNQMGKTDRKNILLGLSGDRAAVIAKKLIN